MNTKQVLIGLAALSCGTLVAAESPVTTITTNAGKTYKNVRVFQVDPDGVMFSHQNGGAKVLFGELPDEVRTKLGYSADKEATYKKEHAEKLREERKQALEYQKEQMKAEAAASAVQLKRLEIIREQNYSGGYYGGGGLITPAFWNDGAYPLFDGNGYGYGYGSGFGGGYGYGHGYRSNRGTWTIPPEGTTYNNGNSSYRSRGYRGPVVRGNNVPYGIPALGNLAPSLAPRAVGGGVRAGVNTMRK